MEENKQATNAVGDWSKIEKYYLHEAVQIPSRTIEDINDIIQTKSPVKIQSGLAYYKKIAKSRLKITNKPYKDKGNHNKPPSIPLASWAKILTDGLTFEELQTETAIALRILAEINKIPSPVCTEKVNFNQIYHLIADSLEGKPIIEVTPLDNMAIGKCMLETALFTKGFIRTRSLKYLIQNSDLSDKEINYFQKPMANNALGNMQHLAGQRNFNPLQIPEEYLKSTKGLL